MKSKIFKISHKFNMSFLSKLINQYPEIKSGRKNYLEKEYELAENICLTKLYIQTKKYKLKSMKLINFKKLKNKIILTAKIFY